MTISLVFAWSLVAGVAVIGLLLVAALVIMLTRSANPRANG